MNQEIQNILELRDKNIDNLWNNNSQYNVTDAFTRISRSYKTLIQLSKQFKIVIDDNIVSFV